MGVVIRRLPLLGLAVVGLIVAVGAALWWQRNQGGTHRATIDEDSVVLLGDSITEEGDWERLLPGRPVVNQGHSAFTSEQLIPVAAEVVRGRPRMVVVLAGTNDIRDGHGPEWTVVHLGGLLDELAAGSPETTVVLQTLLPRADAPTEVVATNDALVELARDRGVTLIDLHPHFDDGTGALRPAETRDGLHLSEAGYRRWAALLESFLTTGEVPAPDR